MSTPAHRIAGLVGRLHLRTVRDAGLRSRLTPADEALCKRPVLSLQFYRAVQRENVDVVTSPIERIEPDGIVTRDGSRHRCDVLILATGFRTHAYMTGIDVTGRDGLRLAELWRDGPRSYRSVSVPGFPNFFTLLGPFSPVATYPIPAIAEIQAAHVLWWLRRWRSQGPVSVCPTQAAARRFHDDLQAAVPRTVWASGCRNTYTPDGGVPETWPWSPTHFRRMLGTPDLADHDIRPGTAEDPATP